MLWPEPKALKEATFRPSYLTSNGPPELNLYQQILRAFCLVLVKTCDIVHEKISKETYYEVCGPRFERLIRANTEHIGRRLLHAAVQPILALNVQCGGGRPDTQGDSQRS